MENTLNEFKNQQKNTLLILEKLAKFLEQGEKIGVEINSNLTMKLANIIQEVETKKLKVALIGGFSEGKTSIAAAWMEKLDKESMKITFQESSDEVKIYEVGDIELVDTPGLFGFKEKYNVDNNAIEKYKEITTKYVSEAHLIIYVMNSVNPIKESHKDDLLWLFKTLNLLPRTIFVLSRFDEVSDVEDEESYAHNYSIKKNNVKSRLADILELSQDESSALSIVAVSANPFDMGMEYWLSNMDKFKKLSHIDSLQLGTSEKIKKSGGMNQIVNQTRKTVIQDVLEKQLPIAVTLNDNLSKAIIHLGEINQNIEKGLNQFLPQISESRIYLREFINNHFSTLILKAKGLSLETANNFIEKEIGSEGVVLNAKLQNVFESQTEAVSIQLKNIELDFNTEIKDFTVLKQGMKVLSKSGMINAKLVLATRDGIVTGAKFVGLDIAKYLKFKPWGATNFAAGAQAGLAVVGLALEIWDSYNKSQQEKEFQSGLTEMIKNFENQRQQLFNFIDGEDFIVQFFPNYTTLKNNAHNVEIELKDMKQEKEAMEEWVAIGEIINKEFSEIK